MGCVQSTGVDEEAKARTLWSHQSAKRRSLSSPRQRPDREPAEAGPRHGEERD